MSANPDRQMSDLILKRECHGILLVDKPVGKTAFSLVGALRRVLGIQKIGHAGTLDPFATGVMVMLVGKTMTRLSHRFLCQDKEYIAQVRLGISTDTYDCEGNVEFTSSIVPSEEEINAAIQKFQGQIEQIPPMFSAKKVDGKKLYELARKGKVIERQPAVVFVETTCVKYEYPFLNIHVKCSKGTYVRSIAHDLGQLLGCGAHLSALKRTRSGLFKIEDCMDGSTLFNQPVDPDQVRKALFYPK